MVRNHMFRHVELFAFEKEEQLAALDSYLEDAPDWPAAMDDYVEEYADLGVDADARSNSMVGIDERPGGPPCQRPVRQTLDGPAQGDCWAFEGMVDLAATDAAGEVRLASLVSHQG